jgi:hypothetical protein
MRWLRRIFGKKPKATAPEESPSAPTFLAQSTSSQAVTFDLDAMIEAAQSLNLRKEKAFPLLYLDRSGSTDDHPNHLWTNGTMQLLTSLVAAVTLGGFSATTTKTAPLRFFHDKVLKPLWPANGQISRDNVHEILGRNRDLDFGGTYFIPVLMDMVRQALLVNARTTLEGGELAAEERVLEQLSDAELLEFITPEVDDNGKEVLKPLLALPYPIASFWGTDGLSSESLIRLLGVLRWMSQLGIYIMLVGVGHHDFDKLKSMDKAGEALALQKGVRPLWDNVDFVDLKDLTGSADRLPDGPTVITLLVGKFMSTAYGSCRELHLIA